MQLSEIKMANTATERYYNNRFRSLQLTGTQAAVLQLLYESDNRLICQQNIEHALNLTHSTVSSILKRLEKQGLIETRTLLEDNRYHEILLTSKGKKYKAKIDPIFTEIKQSIFQDFSPMDLERFSEYLTRVTKNAQEANLHSLSLK